MRLFNIFPCAPFQPVESCHMPDLTLPDDIVARMDAEPERGAPYFVSRNKTGAALLTEAMDNRDRNRSDVRRSQARGKSAKPKPREALNAKAKRK